MNDGLGDLIASASTLAFCSKVLSGNEATEDDYKAVARITASEAHTRDLFRLDAVLASVGWNKNDDIFDRYETWNARETPEDKQFNYMHDEKDIIGHITKSYILDDKDNRIDSINDLSELPEFFDVIMGSVLYKTWSDETLKNRMDKIIAEIQDSDPVKSSEESEKKQWYVSMECLFPAFDYQLIHANGKIENVRRNESSAFLTKYLKAYGGSGKYNGYKVGRLLRDFSFSGVGLVERPANPRSIILNKTKSTFSKGKTMSEDLDVLKNELAEARKIYDTMKQTADEIKMQSEASISSLSAQLAELQSALAAEKKEKEKMAEEMKNMKKEKTMMKRKAQLVDAGFSNDEADETIVKFETLDDSMFEVVVATLKTKAESLKVKASECEDEEDDEKEKMTKSKKTKADEEVDANEPSGNVLPFVEPSKEVPMVQDSENESIKSFATEWFSNNVLKTTAGIKE